MMQSINKRTILGAVFIVFATCSLQSMEPKGQLAINSEAQETSPLVVKSKSAAVPSKVVPVFKQVLTDEELADRECVICLEALIQLEKLPTTKKLPLVSLQCDPSRYNAYHVYHAGCYEEWMSAHTKCPICKTEIEDNSKRRKVLRGYHKIQDGLTWYKHRFIGFYGNLFSHLLDEAKFRLHYQES